MRYISLFLLIIISCKQNNRFNKNKIDKITEKIIVFELGNGNYSTNKYITIEGEIYVIENRFAYDSSGIAIEVQNGSAEGLVSYSKTGDNGKMLFDKSMENIKITINQNQNYIVDDKDTIKVFQILKKENLLKCEKDNNGRIVFYKYK